MTESRISDPSPHIYSGQPQSDLEPTATDASAPPDDVHTCNVDAAPAETTGASDADSGTSLLLAKYKKPLPTFVSQANNHAERVMETPAEAFRSSAGVNAATTAAYAEFAALQGTARNAPLTVEVASVSGQAGRANEVSATLLHLGAGTASVQGTVDVFKAEAHGGVYNPDGSTGVNVGASVTVIGAEAQFSDGASSFNFGLSLGAGAEASVGARDADADGATEVCGRVALGPVAIGLCLEFSDGVDNAALLAPTAY
jgi:hypothetical protein